MGTQHSVLNEGEKIHVITRRYYHEQARRHFVGTVRAFEAGIARVEGYVFVHNPSADEFQRRPEVRTRIIGVFEAEHIVNVLPADLDLSALKYKKLDARVFVTDGLHFSLEVSEFGSRR